MSILTRKRRGNYWCIFIAAGPYVLLIRDLSFQAQLESVRNRKRAKRDNELPKKKVKAEPNPQFVPGDVIDLTI